MLQWKTDEDGNRVTENGLPVVVLDDGTEAPLDLDKLNATLAAARSQAASYRKRVADLEPLEDELSTLRKIVGDDVGAFNKELDGLRALKRRAERKTEGEGEDADALSERIYELEQQSKTLEEQLEAARGEVDKRRTELERLTVGAQFEKSSWFAPWIDKDGQRRQPRSRLDPETAQLKFGAHFRPGENGAVVATWTPGGKDYVMSKADGGKRAPFDDAIEQLAGQWDRWPMYLPSAEPGGMGAREMGASTGGQRGAQTISRDRFNAMSFDERHEFIKKGGKVKEAAAR